MVLATIICLGNIKKNRMQQDGLAVRACYLSWYNVILYRIRIFIAFRKAMMIAQHGN